MSLMLAISVSLDELSRFQKVIPIVTQMLAGNLMAATMLDAGDAAFAVNFATKFPRSVQGCAYQRGRGLGSDCVPHACTCLKAAQKACMKFERNACADTRYLRRVTDERVYELSAM